MQCRLGPLQFGVHSAQGHQFAVRSLFADESVLDDTDQVSILDCGQSMGNHDASTARSSGVQR